MELEVLFNSIFSQRCVQGWMVGVQVLPEILPIILRFLQCLILLLPVSFCDSAVLRHWDSIFRMFFRRYRRFYVPILYSSVLPSSKSSCCHKSYDNFELFELCLWGDADKTLCFWFLRRFFFTQSTCTSSTYHREKERERLGYNLTDFQTYSEETTCYCKVGLYCT